MSDITTLMMAAAGGGVEETDANFNQTVLLLHGDGTNGAQNNTFVDSSTNNFTITRNGNTTQGTFSPFSQPDGRWSNYFDGTGDYLDITDNGDLDFGTGDFTVEAWIYSSVAFGTLNRQIIDTRPIAASTANGNYIFFVNTSSKLAFNWQDDGASPNSAAYVSTASLSSHAWNHVAASRDGNTLRLFINGSLDSSHDVTGKSFNASLFRIGYRTYEASSIDYWNGYLASLRCVKGTAVYTSAFTPSTSPLTAVSGTSLLTCQSNRFVDNSSNAFAITRNGDVKVTPFSPFAPTAAYDPAVNGGSGYFDGTGDFLSAPSNAAFAYGTGAFTVEAWIYRTSTTDDVILTSLATGESNCFALYIASNTVRVRETGVADLLTSSATIPVNAWTHIATARSGTTLSLWVNGSRADGGTVTNSTNFGQPTPQIGANSSGTNPIDGYLSGLRVVKGSAVYDPTSTTITVPTAPLTAVSGTSLLLNFTNAGIYDNTGKNNLETVGNAQIDTTTKKYGTGSMEFDGTGDGLRINGGENFAFGSGDFSIECWIYLNNVSGIKTIYDSRPAAGPFTTQPVIYVNGASIRYYANGADRITGANLSATTWYHIAVTRSGTDTKLFVDGTQSGSTYTDSTVYTNATNAPVIGIGGDLANGLNGFIDDLRITKGVARTITVPTKAYPDL